MGEMHVRPTADQVFGRVWLGGVVWGPIGGVVLGMLYALGPVVDGASSDGSFFGDSTLDEVTSLLVLALVYGVPLGFVVGFALGPVAGVALLVCRGLGPCAPAAATALSLAVLAVAGVLLVQGEPWFLAYVVLPVCLVAAWPLHRTLRWALRTQELEGGRS